MKAYIKIEGEIFPAPEGEYAFEDGTVLIVKEINMKQKSIDLIIERAEKFMDRRFQPFIIEEAKEQYEKEIQKARREGAISSIIKIFAIVGLLFTVLSFFSCTKCVTCTTTTTLTDLQDNVTATGHESFPICDRNEKKYWNGRTTNESKGTYKEKTKTTCD